MSDTESAGDFDGLVKRAAKLPPRDRAQLVEAWQKKASVYNSQVARYRDERREDMAARVSGLAKAYFEAADLLAKA